MRSADLDQLKAIASQAGCTLVVRAPSRHAEMYLHRSDFTARPIGLDLPAAENNASGKQLRGLVVAHPIHPGVYAAQDRARAAESWKRLRQQYGNAGEANALSGPYSVELDVDSPHYGVVRYAGRYVHDGYELLAASSPGHGLPTALIAAAASMGAPAGALGSLTGLSGLAGRTFENGLLAIGPDGKVHRAGSAADVRGMIASGGSR